MSYFTKAFFAVLLLVLLWAIGFGCFALSSLIMTPHKTDVKTDTIVVLTGGDNRIETGLALLAEGKAPQLFISGVYKDVTIEDIKNMWKGNIALPECCIVLGPGAKSTTQNAEETKGWMRANHFKSMRLVTANYHMHRARSEMAFSLPDVLIIPHPVRQEGYAMQDERFWIVIFEEYHKTLFRLFTLLFNNFIPDSQ